MIIMLNMLPTKRFLELVDSCALNYFEIAYKFVVYTSCFKALWASNWSIVVLHDMFGLVCCRCCGKIAQSKVNGCFMFVFSFGLVEKFPFMPLLKAYLEHQRKALEEITKK